MIIRRGKINIAAAGLSVAAHLMLLGGFAAVRLGASTDSVPAPLGAVSLRTDRQIIQPPLITPKPQVKHETKTVSEPQPVVPPEADLTQEETSPVPQSPVQPSVPEPILAEVKPELFEAEFFGQDAVARTMCFVVDCSGSMYGRLGLIKQQLKTCIASLRETQSFYLILFMDGSRFMELGEGRAVYATGSAKAQAFAMIDGIRLKGKTNARQALERGMRIRDTAGRPVELIYFITDGFELQTDSSGAFFTEVASVRRKTAPSVCINTIGLWVSAEDQESLRKIAEMTGGQYISVEEIHDDL